MAQKDPRVDAYIEQAAGFARPILKRLRALVHKGCPEVRETLKWGFPHFEHHGILCSMASFKQHCCFGFWKASLLSDPKKLLRKVGDTAMGQFGRITSPADLPSDATLVAFVREAAALNEQGMKAPAQLRPRTSRALSIPDYFLDALRQRPKALETFEGFSYTNKKEYVEWVSGAKAEGTRSRRLKTAVEWLADGKVRNWKYIK